MEAWSKVQRDAFQLAPVLVQHQQRLLLPRLPHGHCAADGSTKTSLGSMIGNCHYDVATVARKLEATVHL